MRIALAGVPRAGKTTRAGELAAERGIEPGSVFHTDDLIELGWSEASAAAADWFEGEEPWIVEGMAVPRALRKWLATHEYGKPCDLLIWLGEPHLPLSDGQHAMGKGARTVMREIITDVYARGVRVLGWPS